MVNKWTSDIFNKEFNCITFYKINSKGPLSPT
jgi:hypothetical protein